MGSVAPIGTLIGFGAVVAVVSGAGDVERRQVATGAIALGALAAGTGWAGVVLRASPWAHVDGGLWRAATTVTYANAAAAVMAPLALLAIGELVARPTFLLKVATTALVIGLGATVSRAGIASFGVGCVVLVAVVGVRPVARASLRPLGGALIALAALAPSMPAQSSTRPTLAVLGLVAGLAVATTPIRGRLPVWPILVVVVAAVPVIVLQVNHHGSVSSLWSDRASLSSPDRNRETHVALGLLGQNPIVGVGPGRTTLTWVTADHRLVVDRYVHDEYLQLALEEGLPALLLLAVLGMAVVDTAARGRRYVGVDKAATCTWAGAVAGIACIALHSGFDFLWHVPIVLFVAALLIGIASPPATAAVPIPSTNQEVP